MSVVAGWRKHLRSAKYGKHMALDEFYKEMPDKVDDLIEKSPFQNYDIVSVFGPHVQVVRNIVDIMHNSITAA